MVVWVAKIGDAAESVFVNIPLEEAVDEGLED
jgi:hypothetical protein